ncbi:MAG: HIT family protein [Planctomycetes bacterium]|nr:HIT family protein [Planctomycetota bacterium]
MNEPNCVFCKIAAGQIPSHRIFEDASCLAFLDIGPLAGGHALLIPKSHWASLDQMPADAAAAMLRNLPAICRAIRAATGCEGFNILQNNGTCASQVVMHVHFHIIPRNPGDEFHFNWPSKAYTRGEAEELAAKISRELR